MRKTFVFVIVLSVALLALAACQPQTVEVTRVVTEVETVTEEVEVPVEVTRVVTEVQTETVVEEVPVEVAVEVEKAPLGSEERPIKVLFVPSVEVDAIITGGEVMAAALEEATGFKYEVVVPTSYAATIEEMCASPDDTIGFIPAQGYVLANERCGVTVGAAAVRFGLSWYAAQYVVPFDSDAQTVADLDGKSWCIPDYGSTSGYLYPSVEFLNLGIEPGEIIEAGSHNNAMLGVYNGDCDFGTAFFSPPLLPNYERNWTFGVDDPEIWRDAGEEPVRNEEGRTFVAGGPDEGGYRILDARSSVSDTAPDIFSQTRILALTDKIPNDTVSFGPEFPLSLANDIVNALVDFTASDACLQSICSEEFYNWTGIEPVPDRDYDPVRALMSALGITEEDVFGDN
ncbi:MAG: PhnD/SsuA/transferrin family substrate-binding protein [Anaerolineales bacterium]|nr:PhnD/SsuA/transferrin family substrate-binding protein [Anaerolineales bacterium]MCB8966257.1 PhnD/SsuA/transferrin family substrate-binding protein [Ardenticatenaceae bacterium]